MNSVYKTQCKTFKVAQELTGNNSNVSSFKGAFKPPFCLRTLPAYRTKDIQRFRNSVAKQVKLMRAK